MVFVERLTRVLFALLFGWVLLLLAAETRWRRDRRRRERELERALAARPALRPTVERSARPWRRDPATPTTSTATAVAPR